MNIHVFKNKIDASSYVLKLFQETLEKNTANFGLATGSTPETLYALLRQSDLDFSQASAINLDEYFGLSADHPQSYAYFMKKQLFNDKPFKHTFIPNGMNRDTKDEINSYEKILHDHPIDLQILGIGTNGHIGFNEPGTDFHSKTHLVELTASTINSNKRFFEDASQVPTHAYSMGIESIMNAKKIVLMAFGTSKADIIAQALEGHITENVPASILQKHPNTIVVLDEAASQTLHNSSIHHE